MPLKSSTELTPPPSQSVAALLPEEILDSVFAQFGFDYSLDAYYQDRLERCAILSNMSVVVERWSRPARRLLFRSLNIGKRSQMQARVPDWCGEQVRELAIYGLFWSGMTREEVASAVCRILKQVPNLRRLRLTGLPFNTFHSSDSNSMRSNVFLPLLDDLHLAPFSSFDEFYSSRSFACDLQATSNHGIRRFSAYGQSFLANPQAEHQQLDFCGKLRYLSTGKAFHGDLAIPGRVVLGGLVGLEELRMSSTCDGFVGPGFLQQNREFYRIIGPTLRILSLNDTDVAWLDEFLPLLTQLSRLTLEGNPVNATPIFRSLPPSLSFLRIDNDEVIVLSLDYWIANPSLVPAGLKHIQIDWIYESETFERLPPLDTLSTNVHSHTVDLLRRFSPGHLPFKKIEMHFGSASLLRWINSVEAECARLGVTFRQRVEPWNDWLEWYVLQSSLNVL